MSVLVCWEAMPGGIHLLGAAATAAGARLVVLAADPSMYAAAGPAADIVPVDTDDVSEVERVLRGLNRITGLFSPTDTWGARAGALAAQRGLPVPNDASVIDWYRDKRAVAAAAGAGFVSALGTGPYLVKPRFGTGSVGISVSTDRFEAEAVAQEQNGTLERYEQGPLYSAEVYVRGGRVLHLGVTNRIVSDEPYFVERVKSFPHEPNTQWEHDVERWVDELVGRLRPWRGFLHIEFIETRAGFRLIEVNPRLGGALVGPAIAACTNVDPYGVMVFDALGRPAELPVTALRMGGYSHVSLYAEASGVLAEISGVDRLGSFPGEISWCPSKSAGATLPSGLDYRSRIGNLAAYGPSAPIAQDRVLAAARALTFRVAPAG